MVPITCTGDRRFLCAHNMTECKMMEAPWRMTEQCASLSSLLERNAWWQNIPSLHWKPEPLEVSWEMLKLNVCVCVCAPLLLQIMIVIKYLRVFLHSSWIISSHIQGTYRTECVLLPERATAHLCECEFPVWPFHGGWVITVAAACLQHTLPRPLPPLIDSCSQFISCVEVPSSFPPHKWWSHQLDNLQAVWTWLIYDDSQLKDTTA